ncbi:MAG: hypothetical protein M9908_08545 [Phyllobacteriaceae bacterium]|nr:hypothetical protein [Phyllobacteriaceae bacterium]
MKLGNDTPPIVACLHRDPMSPDYPAFGLPASGALMPLKRIFSPFSQTVSPSTMQVSRLADPQTGKFARIKAGAVGRAEADGMPILLFNDWTATAVMKPTIKPS